MKFVDFLYQLKTKKGLGNKTVCFTGSDYSFLFFSKFFSFLYKKELLDLEFKVLNFETTNQEELLSSLSQTFLGQRHFYWLSNIAVKSSDKVGLKVLNFLLNYKGPHFISFYLDKTKFSKYLKNTNIEIITLDNEINLKLVKEIFLLFDFKLSSSKLSLLKKIFSNKDIIVNLDQVCMLMEYIQFINSKNYNNFINYLADIITNTSPSLNLLSKSFFENDSKEFFNTWSKVADNYPDIFWISFWSEKIYKAYFVVKHLKNNQLNLAKSISFGLPYNFFSKYWENFSLNRLSSYYNFLYTNDFRVKRGSSFYFLDLFYLNHFNYLN